MLALLRVCTPCSYASIELDQEDVFTAHTSAVSILKDSPACHDHAAEHMISIAQFLPDREPSQQPAAGNVGMGHICGREDVQLNIPDLGSTLHLTLMEPHQSPECSETLLNI